MKLFGDGVDSDVVVSNANNKNSGHKKDCEDKLELNCTKSGTKVSKSSQVQLNSDIVRPGLSMFLKDGMKPGCKESKTNRADPNLRQLLTGIKLSASMLSRTNAVDPEQVTPMMDKVKPSCAKVFTGSNEPNFKKSRVGKNSSSFTQLRIKVKESIRAWSKTGSMRSSWSLPVARRDESIWHIDLTNKGRSR